MPRGDTLPFERLDDPRLIFRIGEALGLGYDEAEAWVRRTMA
jgi:hypothetical protein